ncbi:MAG TPA: amidohydrolase family protein [Firmicutes bacterium]|nr:amidohydrolase family protein [Bacillota bacterium]
MAEGLDLKQILKIKVSEDRVNRLMQLTRPDVEGVSDEVLRYLVRQQAQFVNIQYARFQAGIKFTEKDVDELMTGAIDTHAHGGSEPFERLMLEDDMAIEASKAKLRAIVIKTWYTPSVSRIPLINKILDKWSQETGIEPVKVFGGVTLQQSVGGINPEAVKRCLGFPGMKYVWMPMTDSYHHRKVVYDDQSGAGLRILTDDGKHVLPALKEIFKIAVDNDLVIASGHYPHKETRVMVEEALEAGVKRIEVIHPAHIHSKNTIEEMKILAGMGAKLMLSGLGTLCFPLHETGPVYAVRIIKEVGADNLVFGSDFGQIHNPSHVTGMRWMIKMLLAYGATKEEIAKVFKYTPAKHLGLE